MKVVGFDELQKKLRKNVSLVDVKKVVKTNTAQMTENMVRIVPVDTSALKGSITMETSDGGLTGTAGPHEDYDAYVEYGTRFQSAQPYVRPSFNKQKVKFIKDLERLMK